MTDQPLTVRVRLLPEFDAQAFGGYLVGSAPAGEAVVAIPFEAVFDSCAREGVDDWQHLTSELIVHELLHAVQDLLGRAFSEVEVDASIAAARAAYGERCYLDDAEARYAAERSIGDDPDRRGVDLESALETARTLIARCRKWLWGRS